MTLLRVLVVLCAAATSVCGQLHELDGSFLELRRNGAWLVKFYAPWCGHCRKMEPAYKAVASLLQGSGIRVARIDATQHMDVAAEFEVRGYPTIKYISGDREFTHYGDRSADGIVKFARRAHRPAVTQLASYGAFAEVLGDHALDSLFFYVGSLDDPLYTAYQRVAEDYHVKSSFFAGQSRILPSKVVSGLALKASTAAVIVLKDNVQFKFEVTKDDERPLNESLRAWVDAERFVAFPQVSEAGVWEFSTTGKRVALFVVNHTIELSSSDLRFKEIGRDLAMNYRKDFHHLYHFGWMNDISTASSLAMMMRVMTPNLVVLHPVSELFYLRENYDQPAGKMTLAEVLQFLKDVDEGKIQPYGGKSVWARVKRLGFDLATGLLEFIATSPLLALFVLGIPIGVVSLLVYLICCLEPASEDPDEYEDDLKQYGNMVSSHRLTEGPGGATYLGDSEEAKEEEIIHSDKKND